MEHKRIHQILSAPVCLFVKSTEKEKDVFADKKGWFYTIGLASGQSFVAHMDAVTTEEPVEHVFTLRPLNNLLPDLKEVKWTEGPFAGGHGVITECQMAKGVSDEEKGVYESALEPKKRKVAAENINWMTWIVHDDHPLFKRLSDVYNLKVQSESCRRQLLASQKQLKSLEIQGKRPIRQKLNDGR